MDFQTLICVGLVAWLSREPYESEKPEYDTMKRKFPPYAIYETNVEGKGAQELEERPVLCPRVDTQHR